MLYSNKFVFFGRIFIFVEWKNVYKFLNLIFFVYVLENNYNKINKVNCNFVWIFFVVGYLVFCRDGIILEDSDVFKESEFYFRLYFFVEKFNED